MDLPTVVYYLKFPAIKIRKAIEAALRNVAVARTRSKLSQAWDLSKKTIRPCPICNKYEFIDIADRDRHDIGIHTVLCRTCGFALTNPQPAVEFFKNFYKFYYWDLYFGRGSNHNALLKYWRSQSDTLVKTWEKAGINLYGNQVFEMGCGPGYSLEAITERWECTVHALEPSFQEAKRVGVFFPNAVLINSTVEDLIDVPEAVRGHCDFVFSTHVFEHVYDLEKAFWMARELVRPSGQVYIEVPDLEYMGWKFPHMFHMAHLWHFDEDSLTFLASKFGLRKKMVFRGITQCIKPSGIGILFDVAETDCKIPDSFLNTRKRFEEIKGSSHD